MFIDDVVDAYLKTAENPGKSKSETINIGCGKQETVGNVVNAVVKSTGNKCRPEWGGYTDGRPDSNMWQADISKAEKLLDWRPKHNIEQGLNKTVNWFRDNMELYKDFKHDG